MTVSSAYPSQVEFTYDCVFRYPARLSLFMTVSSDYPTRLSLFMTVSSGTQPGWVYLWLCPQTTQPGSVYLWLCPQTTQPGSVYLWLCLQQTLIIPCLTNRNILSQISLTESAILPKGGVWGVGGLKQTAVFGPTIALAAFSQHSINGKYGQF